MIDLKNTPISICISRERSLKENQNILSICYLTLEGKTRTIPYFRVLFQDRGIGDHDGE